MLGTLNIYFVSKLLHRLTSFAFTPEKNLGFADAPGLKDEEGKAPLVSTKTTVEPAGQAGQAGQAALEPHRPLARQQYELNSQSGSLIMPTFLKKFVKLGSGRPSAGRA